MTSRKPPQGPPPIPPFGSYYPAEERTGEPGWGHGDQGHAPLGPDYHDLDRALPQHPDPHPQGPYGHVPAEPSAAGAPPYHYPPHGSVPPQGPSQYHTTTLAQSYAEPPQAASPRPQSQHAQPSRHEPHAQQPGAYQAGPPGRTRPPPPMRPGGPPPMRPAHRQPPRPPGDGGRVSVLRIVLLLALALVVVAGAGGAYLLFALPPDFVRDEIARQVKSKTGRDLVINGATSFTLYPSIGISMGDVTLSPAPGMTGKPLVTMAALDASVELLPLLKREIRLERLVLEKPVFELYADAKGRKSWEFASPAGRRPVRIAQADAGVSDAPGGLPGEAPSATAASDAGAGPRTSLDQLTLGDVRIVDGTLHYADSVSGTEQQLDDINVGLGLTALNQPLTAKGDLAWKGEKIAFDGEMMSLKAVMEDKPAKLALNVASAPVEARFDGSVILRDAVETDGAVSLKSASLRKLAGWLGTVLPPAKGFGPLEARGQLRTLATTMTLSNASLSLDGATATGQLSIDTSGERPLIKTTLQLSELDLNKYMRPAGTPPSAPVPAKAPAKRGPAAAPAAGTQKPASIDDLLREDKPAPGPKVQGYEQRAGWSSEPIDFSGLGLADADAKLSVDKLFFEDIKVGQSQLTVALKNRVLKTNFDDIQLYGGRGRGFITIDATGQRAATVGTNMTVEGLDARPFLTDAAGFDKLSGKAKLTIAVAGQGATQLQLVETLNGKADLVFSDGAVGGINVAGMVRGLSQGKLTGLGTSPADKTDFSELGSTWTITNGVAQNHNLHLMSPLLRLTGAGTVALPQRQVDYVMRPRLVSSLSGQGGSKDESGIEIPVKIQGPWDRLSYTPDVSGIMKDPNKALEQVKKIGEQFKGKDAGELLKGILGGNKGGTSGQSGSAGTGQQKLDAKGLLDGLTKQ